MPQCDSPSMACTTQLSSTPFPDLLPPGPVLATIISSPTQEPLQSLKCSSALAMSAVVKLVCGYFSLGSSYFLRQGLKYSCYYMATDNLQVLTPMCPARECWGYTCSPPHLVYVGLGTEPKTS